MSQILHVARKDTRHLRWVFACWIALTAVRVLLDTNRGSMQLAGPMTAIIAVQLSSLMSFVELIAAALIASLLVHEDPAVGRDAFWLTRPIAPGALAFAKLMLGFTVLVLIPLAGDLLTLARFNAEPGEIIRSVPSVLLTRASMALLFFLAAAITPSLARFAMVIVGVIGACVLFFAILTTAILLFVNISDPTPVPELINPLPGTISSLALIAVSLSVTVYQYRHRRLWRAVVLAVSGLLAVVIAPEFWPWRVTPAAPDPGAWARDEVRSAAVLEPDPPQVSDRLAFQRREPPMKQIAAHVQLAALPDDLSIRLTLARSRFDVGGTTIESKSSEMVSVRLEQMGRLGADTRPLQSALGGVRIFARAGEVFEAWPVVLKVGDEVFARFSHTPGRLTTDLDFYLQRYVVAAAAPLRAGQFFRDDGRRVAITRVDPRPDNCTVFFREIVVPRLFTPGVHRQEEIVLRNRARGEAIRGDQDWTAGGDVSPFSVVVGAAIGGFSGGSPSTGHGFSVREYSIRFPSRGTVESPLDAAWLADAEIVRVAADYAGLVSRSLTVENFQMVR
jgi:hypothetical protein